MGLEGTPLMAEEAARSGEPVRPGSDNERSSSPEVTRSDSDQPPRGNRGPRSEGNSSSDPVDEAPRSGAARRRRGSRGGKNRRRPQGEGGAGQAASTDESSEGTRDGTTSARVTNRDQPELPDLPWEGQPAGSNRPKPRIGDTIPASALPTGASAPIAGTGDTSAGDPENAGRRNQGRNRNTANRTESGRSESVRGESGKVEAKPASTPESPRINERHGGDRTGGDRTGSESAAAGRRRRGGRGGGQGRIPTPTLTAEAIETRRGRERNGKPIGRYLMCVHVRPSATQIAVLEGRSLIEHYVSQRDSAPATPKGAAAGDTSQIYGNIYLGRVQNVLPGMEAAFVDIATPKNAVLYRSDVAFDTGDIEGVAAPAKDARIEQLLKNGQLVVCQVTKNPIGQKGARLTQEVSLPGRFVVLVPNSATLGISKRLPDDERKRLRRILDEVRPAQHGIIVRTAAAGASGDELQRDVALLVSTWEKIEAKAAKARGPVLLHREPELAVRIIREEFNGDYRGVVIDDKDVYEEVRSYVESISPELADRVEYHDPSTQRLPIFEQYHVHEQLHKAIDRKVWLPSGGSLIIERTEALTVIDVNTGKNVGTTSLEETVFRNNLEAAEEIARQLRLRDIGGIIVIDFIDMEIRANRASVVNAFREALSRDKTRTQVFEISDLGLVEMTRKRISEGLVEALSDTCPTCNGRGFVFDPDILDE